jgi:hypothetical protein
VETIVRVKADVPSGEAAQNRDEICL